MLCHNFSLKKGLGDAALSETLTDSFLERSLVPYSRPKDGTLNSPIWEWIFHLGLFIPPLLVTVSLFWSLWRGVGGYHPLMM